MSHPAAQQIPIVRAAALLGLAPAGRHAHCFNGRAHKSGRDAHPSLVLFPDSNRYKCFACGVGGDLIDLVQRVRGVEFREAVQWIRASASSARPTISPTVPKYIGDRAPDEADLEVYATLYLATVEISEEVPAGRYLRDRRGLDVSVIRRYPITQIADADALWRHLVDQFGLPRLESAGLLSRAGHFLFASHHLLFFYFDDGKPVYVQARDITGEARCKELSLTGRRCPAPYNADQLKDPQNTIHICEGCIDTLSALQLGHAAVGVPGVTGFRKDWFDRFRGVQRVVILFDNDDAGRREAAELRSQFRLRGIKAEALHPQGVNDINDLLRSMKGV